MKDAQRNSPEPKTDALEMLLIMQQRIHNIKEKFNEEKKMKKPERQEI